MSSLFKIIIVFIILGLIFGFFKFIRGIGSSFQKTITIVTFIVLIICLLTIGATIQSSSTSAWPPIYPECPDYFDVVSSTSSGAVCRNAKKLGNESCYGITDFTTSEYSGTSGLCNKNKWATTCNISWDGITYGAENPCTSTTTTTTS